MRSIHTGDTTMSAVRRPGAHRAYLREVSRQTMILRLQGVSISNSAIEESLNVF